MTQKNNRLLSQQGLFLLSWIAYFVTYIGRLGWAASMPEIVRVEGYSFSQASLALTLLFAAYGIGQVIGGFIGDSAPPRLVIFFGMLGSAACNLVVGLAQGYYLMLFAWCANGLLQAFVWPSMVRLYSISFTRLYLHKASINIQASTAAGSAFTYIYCGLMIYFFNWRASFIGTFAIMSVMAFVWLIKTKNLAGAETSKPHQVTQASSQKFNGLFLSSGLLFILLSSVVVGVLRDGITSWVPVYLSDTFSINSSLSIVSAAVLPVVNLVGVYVCTYVYVKNKSRELHTSALLFLSAAAALVLLALAGWFMVISLALFCIITAAMTGVTTIATSIIPTYFVKLNKTSLVAGLINAMVYAGSALSGVGIGLVTESFGWSGTRIFWIILGCLACVLCFVVAKTWEGFKDNQV